MLHRWVAAVLAVAALAGACSKDTDNKPEAKAATTTSSTIPVLAWKVEGVDANGTAPPGDDVVKGVKATLDAYLAQGVVAPLQSGSPAGDLSAVLSAAAIERITADATARAVLLDEGLPAATTSITADTATATLSTVAGPDGVTAIVAARLDLKIKAVGPTAVVDIVRQGELTLIPESGGWRIDSFGLRAQRDSRP